MVKKAGRGNIQQIRAKTNPKYEAKAKAKTRQGEAGSFTGKLSRI